MNSKAKLCNSCNSEIITVKRHGVSTLECSYCGKQADTDFAFYEEDSDGDKDE